jgi:hypothetical protein
MIFSAIRKPVGRKRKWHEQMQARFAPGTFARIAVILGETEDRTDFVREAVERELRRREAERRRSGPTRRPAKSREK